MPKPPKNARHLDADDLAIWRKVARTVTPRDYVNKDLKSRPSPNTGKLKSGSSSSRPMIRILPKTRSEVKALKQQVDYMADKKTRRGRVRIDRKIDLHDLTLVQAQSALTTAILSAHAAGLRCVLVVTGKGVRLEGKLRRAFPDWINAPELRSIVAHYSSAHIRHGGSGAWYVFLKRSE